MIVQGTVTKLMGDNALVVVDCAFVCAGCKCCRKEDNLNYVEAINNIGAKISDKVLVWLDTKGFIKSVFFIFIIPIFLFLATVVSVAFISKTAFLKDILKDFISFASGMVILLVYFVFIAVCHKNFFIPSRITQIL